MNTAQSKRPPGRPPGVVTVIKSDAVRRLRSAAGLTQQGLATRLGCSVSSVTRWEREGILPQEPMLKNFKKLAGAAGVEVP